MLAFLTRRQDKTPETKTTAQAPTQQPANADDNVLMRFLTQGGAAIELRRHEFKTNYTYKGRPYVGDDWYLVNGFKWTCLGCGKSGGPTLFETKYLPSEGDEARDHANQHATDCRAMPRPNAV
jgi:hypothetical protein